MTVLRSGAATDVGRVRASNEDMALESPALYAVADGMGGHVGGEVAARTAIEVLHERFSATPTAGGLVTAVSAANMAVWRRGQEDRDLHGMGTTLTAVALVASTAGDDVLVLVNVGDSRAYLLSGDRLVQLTADHSLAEEKVRQGQMTPEEAAVHPHRHILTRALGVGPGVFPDVWELHVHTGERLLLCSDGLSNEVSPEQMVEVLQEIRDADAAAQALVDRANALGGSDNITALVVDVMVGEDGARDALLVPIDARPVEDPEGTGSGGGVGGGAGALLAEGAAGASALDISALDIPGLEDPTTAVPAVGPRPGAPPDADAPGQGGAGEGGTAADGPDERGPDERGAAEGDAAEAGPDAVGLEGHGLDLSLVGADVADGGERDGERTRTAMVVGGRAYVPDPDDMAATGITPIVAADLPPPTGKKKRRRDRPRREHPRRITLRVVLFVLLLAAIVAGAYFVVRWYATDNYFVTIDHGEIVIYQGRPGGMLGFDPTVVKRTGVTTADVLPSRLPALRGKVQEPTRKAAVQYVANLQKEAEEDRTGTFGGSGEVFASTTTTTTTVPPVTGTGAATQYPITPVTSTGAATQYPITPAPGLGGTAATAPASTLP